MAKTDLNMKITDAYGKSSTSKVSYVNPEATDSQLVAFAQKVNQLTTNQLDGASRVTTTELSTAAKLFRKISSEGNSSFTLEQVKSSTLESEAPTLMTIIVDADDQEITGTEANIGAYVKENTTNLPVAIVRSTDDDRHFDYDEALTFLSKIWNTTVPQAGTITIAFPETDHYIACERTFTITE